MKAIDIIGGGIAGLALGIALRRRQVPVAVHEASSYPRHKVCGEFLAGRSQVREALGLEELFHDAHQHTQTRWYAREQLRLRRDLPVPALGLSRYVLDQRLAECFTTLGGELHTRTRLDPEAAPGRVLACGRERRPTSPWLGLKAHVRLREPTEGLEMHFGRGAYVGLSAVEDGWVNVCGLFQQADLRAPREALLPTYLRACGLPALADRVEAGEIRPGSTCGVSALQFGFHPTTGLRLGDQMAVIPPFTGNGMSLALESAALAAPPLADYAQGSRDWATTCRAVQAEQQTAFRRRLRWANGLQRLLLHPWSRALLAAPGVSHLFPFQLAYHRLH